VRGCTKISPGCVHCHAETFAERFRGVPGHPFEFGFDLRLVPEKLGDPIRWSKPKKIFVNSMSGLFHEGAGRIHRKGLPGDAGGKLACLPGSHKTGRPHGGIAARQVAEGGGSFLVEIFCALCALFQPSLRFGATSAANEKN
jgi:hypothetical protein